MKREKHTPVFRVILTDLLMLNLINFFFVHIIKGYSFRSSGGGERYLLLLILFNLLWIVINVVVMRYRLEIHRGVAVEIKKIFLDTALFTGVISIFAFLLKDLRYSRLIIYGTIIVFAAGLMVSHLAFIYILRWIRQKKLIKKRVLIVGDDHAAIHLSNELLSDKAVDYAPLVYIENDTLRSEAGSQLMVGKLADVKTIFKREKFDELFIVVSTAPGKEVRKIIKIADYYGVRVRMVPGFYKLFEQNFEINMVNQIPIINVNEIPLDGYYNSLYKKYFDIFFSLFVLVLASPVLVTIGLLVKLTSKGPVFYVAERVGMGGKVFKLYKFRTMVHSNKKQDRLSTQPNDTRVTRLGRFLRRSNLDELPQFFNVLKGEMSVVGPRPHRVYLDKKLQNSVSRYMIRHYIKPGITGWAQVNGWRGPTDKSEQKKQRIRHDLWYIKNWSFRLDIKIIFLTLFSKKSWKNAF
jgi:putative colanic acid biosynthesis UDP-glucose lipid carrier transferase